MLPQSHEALRDAKLQPQTLYPKPSTLEQMPGLNLCQVTAGCDTSLYCSDSGKGK